MTTARIGARAAVFVAALAVGVGGRRADPRLHPSPLLFIVSGVLMLAPGSAGFTSALRLLAHQTVTGIAAAFATLVLPRRPRAAGA